MENILMIRHIEEKHCDIAIYLNLRITYQRSSVTLFTYLLLINLRTLSTSLIFIAVILDEQFYSKNDDRYHEK